MTIIKRFSILVLLLLSVLLKAQPGVSPTILNVGLGIGPNYGAAGAKTVVGYKNSGLLIGLGTFGGEVGLEVGAQIAWGAWFLNAGYAPYYTGAIPFCSDGYKQYGPNVLCGVMIDVDKEKRLFLEIGLGYSWGDDIWSGSSSISAINGVLGIGYRLFDRSKRS